MLSFLDHLDAESRGLFDRIARLIRLAPGEFLVRRGDPGGDLFLLEAGVLEARDRRRSPELLLDTLTPGDVVGEIAFLDGAPRSADVLAVGNAQVLRWDRDDLQALISKHPKTGAQFLQHLSQLAVARVRNLTDTTVGKQSRPDYREGADELSPWMRNVSERFKRAMVRLEADLRSAPDDSEVTSKIRLALDDLEREVGELFTAVTDPGGARRAERFLQQELHPYLLRSALADRSFRRTAGVVGTSEVMAQVLVGASGGDGHLGSVIDAWLMERPTLQALRKLQGTIVQETLARLPESDEPINILVVSAGTGSLVARLTEALDRPAVIRVLDQSRETLALVDRDGFASSVELHTIQEKLVDFASGRISPDLPPQHAVIVHGMVEYLPAPLAVSLAQHCHRYLLSNGNLVVGSLVESTDQIFLDRLLGWPMIRRVAEGIRSIIDAAEFAEVATTDVGHPGHLVIARARHTLATQAIRE